MINNYETADGTCYQNVMAIKKYIYRITIILGSLRVSSCIHVGHGHQTVLS